MRNSATRWRSSSLIWPSSWQPRSPSSALLVVAAASAAAVMPVTISPGGCFADAAGHLSRRGGLFLDGGGDGELVVADRGDDLGDLPDRGDGVGWAMPPFLPMAPGSPLAAVSSAKSEPLPELPNADGGRRIVAARLLRRVR
jgi:hypothetical protein